MIHVVPKQSQTSRSVLSDWTRQLVCNIKSEKSLKYLPVHNLCVCTILYLVLKSVESSVLDITRPVTGTGLLA